MLTTNEVQLWQKGRELQMYRESHAQQSTMKKAANSYLETEQTINACPGNCTRSESEKRTASHSPSMDYCAESDLLILLNHLGAVTKE